MRVIAVTALAAALSACAHMAQAPLPEVAPASAYKEAQPGAVDGIAASTALQADAWWTQYQDPELDRLQQRLIANSPDLASALARYQQAQAATRVLRAARAPTVGVSLEGERDRQSERRPLRGATSPNEYNSATLGLDFEYELDLWGRVRQQVVAGVAREQAAQADLAGARLLLEAQLADNMMSLRGADQELSLLSDTETAYTRAAEMVERRHSAGIASGLDVAQAQAQLEAAHSQRHQLQAQRAVLEHAIAALVGDNASTFSIAPQNVPDVVPTVPTGLPSDLLQRRPDITAAQRRVTAANASVGVARTAFFPSVTLSALGGFQTDEFANLIAAPNRFWAIGPALLTTLFDGGRRKAEVARAEAILDEAGHTYRGVVLAAFQQVEDQLALLHRYGEAATAERAAVAASQQALNLANNRYRDGAASYLDVVTAQTTSLQARRNALDLTTRQRRATVQLARALGGGWSSQQ
jgi:NodT family efflux transporter outer membrane factor (OMF) lipoprotein